MNRRDDCAEICLHTGFSDRAEYRAVFPSEENPVWEQGSSKRASAFMISPGLTQSVRRPLLQRYQERFAAAPDQRRRKPLWIPNHSAHTNDPRPRAG